MLIRALTSRSPAARPVQADPCRASSWTATAAGRRRAACRGSKAIGAGVEAVRRRRSLGDRARRSLSDRLQLLVGELEPARPRKSRSDGAAQALHPQRSGRAPHATMSASGSSASATISRPISRRCSNEAEKLTRANGGLDADRRLQLRRAAGDRRGRARLWRSKCGGGRLDADDDRRGDARPRGSTPPAFPIPIWSSAPRASMRLSNFLLWQAAYAELVFLPILWPDFDRRRFRVGARPVCCARAAFRRGRRASRQSSNRLRERCGMAETGESAGHGRRRSGRARIFGADLRAAGRRRRRADGRRAGARPGPAASGSRAFWLIAALVVHWEWQRLIGGAGSVLRGVRRRRGCARRLRRCRRCTIRSLGDRAALLLGAAAVAGLADRRQARLGGCGRALCRRAARQRRAACGRARLRPGLRSCGFSRWSGAPMSAPISAAG